MWEAKDIIGYVILLLSIMNEIARIFSDLYSHF